MLLIIAMNVEIQIVSRSSVKIFPGGAGQKRDAEVLTSKLHVDPKPEDLVYFQHECSGHHYTFHVTHPKAFPIHEAMYVTFSY